jgi:hypothetical protein
MLASKTYHGPVGHCHHPFDARLLELKVDWKHHTVACEGERQQTEGSKNVDVKPEGLWL